MGRYTVLESLALSGMWLVTLVAEYALVLDDGLEQISYEGCSQ